MSNECRKKRGTKEDGISECIENGTYSVYGWLIKGRIGEKKKKMGGKAEFNFRWERSCEERHSKNRVWHSTI